MKPSIIVTIIGIILNYNIYSQDIINTTNNKRNDINLYLNTPRGKQSIDTIVLKYGSIDSYIRKIDTIVDNEENHIRVDEFGKYVKAIKTRDGQILKEFSGNGADFKEYLRINNQDYLNGITITQYTADMLSIQRIMYCLRNGYYYQIRFCANYSFNSKQYEQLKEYHNNGIYNKNIDKLAKLISKKKCIVDELNNWYRETEEIMKSIEVQ
jgi:hypothetical protein